jgi:hypothetical protein
MDPSNPNNIVAAVFGAAAAGDGGYYLSTNALAVTPTFTQALVLNAVAMKFAINKVGSVVTVLAGSGDGGGASGRLRRSVDGGATWSATIPSANGYCGGQCFYDANVATDPGNANIIFTGGPGNPRILRKSTDGALSFSNVGTMLHADTHAIVFDPSNSSTMYTGDDGGIFKSTDAGNTWTSLNNSTFRATQFQSLSLHPRDREFMIGGTQDNGTEFRKPDSSWFRADFGDGGFALIDQSATDTDAVTMYHTYFNQTNNLIGFARNLTAPCANEGNWAFLGPFATDNTPVCDGSPNTIFNGLSLSDPVLFYAPMALGPGTPNTVYYGTNKLYRSPNRGATMTAMSQALATPISAIGISAQNDNVRIVGLAGGGVFATTTGSSTLTNVTGPIPGCYAARTVIDPNNADTAYVTLSCFGLPAGQHVWKTTNLSGAPPTWMASGSGIPDVPTNAFAIDPRDSTSLYAGTDIGVYHSTDSGATWNPYGTGLPRVAVFDMAIQSRQRVLRIATHGRGIWEIGITPIGPPTIDKAFGADHIPLNGTTSLTFTLTNPNAAPNTLTGIAFTDNLPSGLVLSTPSGLTGSCGGGTITAVDGGTSVSLLGATLASGESCTFSVNVNGISAGLQTNTTGAVTSNETGAGETATASVTVGLAPTITKSFGAATIPLGGTTSLTFNISNPNTDITLNGIAFTDNLPTAAPATLIVATPGSLSSSCTGTATAADGSSSVSLSGASLVAGASCTVSVTVQGTRAGTVSNNVTVTDTTAGTGNTSTAVITVAPGNTTTTVTSSQNPSVFGQSVTFTATVAGVPPAVGTPTGSVTFLDGGNPIAIRPLSGGVATFITSALPVGSHTITTTYAGDANFNGSSGSLTGNPQVVNKANTTTPTVTSSVNPSVFGQFVTFTATITASAPGAGTPSGIVLFKDGVSTIGSGPLSGGVATFSTSTLSVGNHTITTVYNGDFNFNGSTGSLNSNPQVVNQASTIAVLSSNNNPSIFGQSVTFTATVAVVSPGSGTATGTVTFKDGVTTLGTGALSGGVATFTTTALAAGNHTITGVYGGDANFTGTTGSLNSNPQVVNKADTNTTTVTSSLNPSIFGQSVTFTATVAAVPPGAGTPTGMVTFLDGGGSIGSGTLSGGVATFTTSALAAGSHTITTSYGGDANFNVSTQSLTGNPQVVNQSSTTAVVVSNNNPSNFGQSVTFTATLSAVPPGAGTPTGNVTFKDGNTTLGSGALSGGVATFATTTLTAGSHSITAVYGGDANFSGSTSAVLTQFVTGTDISVTLTHAPDPAVIGGKLTFVATVTNNGPQTANVTFTESFIGAQYLVSAVPSTGTCGTTEPVTCPLGSMTTGQSATVTIVVTPLIGRNITGTASMTLDIPNTDSTNSTASSTARIRFKPFHF